MQPDLAVARLLIRNVEIQMSYQIVYELIQQLAQWLVKRRREPQETERKLFQSILGPLYEEMCPIIDDQIAIMRKVKYALHSVNIAVGPR